MATAIDSIVNQTHENLDIVIIDDGSKNDPTKIIDSINWKDRRYRYIRNEKNEGKWSCLNKVIESTSTRWYMIQDADDYAFPWKATDQLRALKESNTSLNLAGYIPIQLGENHTVPILSEKSDFPIISGKLLFEHAGISLRNPNIHHNYTGQYNVHNGASMFSRSFHELGFRFQPPELGLRIARSEDSDFNLRATLQFGRTSWLNKPCYSYRLGSGHPEGSF